MPKKKEETKTTKKTAEQPPKPAKKPRKTLAKADKPLVETSASGKGSSKKAFQSQEYSLPSGKYIYANGKRKTSVARVRLYKGDGSVFINQKPINKFCELRIREELIVYPLKLTGLANAFTVVAMVKGGGMNSQADAVRHGIAKALVTHDSTLRPTLKHAGLLTRDPRSKERKKFGLHRARRGPQFSKR